MTAAAPLIVQPRPKTKEVWFSFSSEIIPTTSEALLAACAQAVRNGVETVHLLLSTPGGGVACGINIYNVLRGMPFHLVTHNVGSVNSIGNVVFLAGEERYACPHTTFMFHGVAIEVPERQRLEERGIREKLDHLQADTKKISSIIVDRTGITQIEADALFFQAETRDTGYAKEKGIIKDVREVKIPKGAPIQQFVFQR